MTDFDDEIDLSKRSTKYLVLRLHEKFEDFEARESVLDKRLTRLETAQQEEDILKREALKRKAEREEELDKKESRRWELKLAIAGGIGAFLVWLINFLQNLFNNGEAGT